MGIKDLLKSLAVITNEKSIQEFSGKRILIDASGWLHKGLFSAAEDFIDSNMEDNQFYVDYILGRTEHLKKLGIEPVFVFDGKRSNLKSETQAKREDGRIKNMTQAKKLIETMKSTKDLACLRKLRNECISCLQRGLSVTHEMEKNCMAALKKFGVKVIVAPMEADPQLAFLCAIGYCQGIITEDSDILVYAAASSGIFPILYKFDNTGMVQTIDLSVLPFFTSKPTTSITNPNKGTELKPTSSTSSSTSSTENTHSINFVNQLNWFPQGESGLRMFMQMCILAGCDYCESVPGIGIIKAQQAVIKFKDIPDNKRLKKIHDFFKFSGKKVPENYLSRVSRAESLFFNHLVYNPVKKEICHFSSGIENQGFKSIAPPITREELRKVGNCEDIFKDKPEEIKWFQLCEGFYSPRDFSLVNTIYPWENPSLEKKMSELRTTHWSTRRGLIQNLFGSKISKNPFFSHLNQLSKSKSFFKPTSVSALNPSAINQFYHRNHPNDGLERAKSANHQSNNKITKLGISQLQEDSNTDLAETIDLTKMAQKRTDFQPFQQFSCQPVQLKPETTSITKQKPPETTSKPTNTLIEDDNVSLESALRKLFPTAGKPETTVYDLTTENPAQNPIGSDQKPVGCTGIPPSSDSMLSVTSNNGSLCFSVSSRSIVPLEDSNFNHRGADFNLQRDNNRDTSVMSIYDLSDEDTLFSRMEDRKQFSCEGIKPTVTYATSLYACVQVGSKRGVAGVEEEENFVEEENKQETEKKLKHEKPLTSSYFSDVKDTEDNKLVNNSKKRCFTEMTKTTSDEFVKPLEKVKRLDTTENRDKEKYWNLESPVGESASELKLKSGSTRAFITPDNGIPIVEDKDVGDKEGEKENNMKRKRVEITPVEIPRKKSQTSTGQMGKKPILVASIKSFFHSVKG